MVLAKPGLDRGPGPREGADTLVGILRDRALTQPDETAYEFLHSDGSLASLTYRELYTRAAVTAARLGAEAAGPGPVILLYPPGLDFVAALWGCLLAGVPAVPAYPPLPQPGDRSTARFRHILADVRPAAVLADPLIAEVLAGTENSGTLPPIICPPPDRTGAAHLPDLDVPLPPPDAVALVQYTSGSTSDPKGVVLRHSNLLHNVRAISDVFGLDTDSRSVSWLPPYHDMGLIGCILTPLYTGFLIRLMSPLDFLKSPLTWLRQISELRATATGGPNFAYDLCVRRARDTALQDLDLSSWQVAFNGAEPVRRGTLEAFSRRFAPHGFRPSAFLPCYGLAEATLIVTGRHWDPAAQQRPAPSPDAVSCGPVVGGTALAIVDEQRHTTLPDGSEGEIWLHGPGITDGYWGREADRGSDETFGHLDGRRFLRTGDLGRLRDGELFVTGRRKDVLVHRGVNHHAHDIEAAAVIDNPEVRPTAAAFMIEDTVEPEVALVVERAPAKAADDARTADRLRVRVLERTGVRVDRIVLCPPRAIPKTTSGKVQRRLTRDRFLAGELRDPVVFGAGPEPAPPDAAAQEPLSRLLAGVFAGVCGQDACGPDRTLAEIGGDSLRAAEIASVTEEALALPVGVAQVLETGTPRRLAARLLDEWNGQGVTAATALERLAALEEDDRATAGTEDGGSGQ